MYDYYFDRRVVLTKTQRVIILDGWTPREELINGTVQKVGPLDSDELDDAEILSTESDLKRIEKETKAYFQTKTPVELSCEIASKAASSIVDLVSKLSEISPHKLNSVFTTKKYKLKKEELFCTDKEILSKVFLLAYSFAVCNLHHRLEDYAKVDGFDYDCLDNANKELSKAGLKKLPNNECEDIVYQFREDYHSILSGLMYKKNYVRKDVYCFCEDINYIERKSGWKYLVDYLIRCIFSLLVFQKIPTLNDKYIKGGFLEIGMFRIILEEIETILTSYLNYFAFLVDRFEKIQ